LRVREPNVKKANAIPDDALEALARCLFPTMVAFFKSEEGKREFAEWQARESIENVPGGIAEPDEEVRVAG